ncbi:ankyrin repeat domain-containing protein 1 isoform X1 [Phocoena sinus]|uniref:ankyrin repeat domain-containing protein 1 isoform X1 n=1 Tax=Phocoena sinus TaxID=42100 RepID=UPI0013C4BBBB|nr:ankyrin repeat domain-containing protein 1 isoform X1 [Phocoena sinus]
MMVLKVEELVTGKKNGSGDAGEFLPEDFRDGEYEAAVTLEKQEDLKTLPAHFVSLREQQWKTEKQREAELKKKKLEQRSKLENLEDLEIIIQLKKRKKYRKTKVPVVKEPEPEIITEPVDVPSFLKAALENKLPVVEKFLSDKNNPDVCDEYKRTALHRACLEGHLAIVEKLIEAGAQIEFRDMLESTAIHWASRGGNLDVLKLLLNKGAKISARDKVSLLLLSPSFFPSPTLPLLHFSPSHMPWGLGFSPSHMPWGLGSLCPQAQGHSRLLHFAVVQHGAARGGEDRPLRVRRAYHRLRGGTQRQGPRRRYPPARRREAEPVQDDQTPDHVRRRPHHQELCWEDPDRSGATVA